MSNAYTTVTVTPWDGGRSPYASIVLEGPGMPTLRDVGGRENGDVEAICAKHGVTPNGVMVNSTDATTYYLTPLTHAH